MTPTEINRAIEDRHARFMSKVAPPDANGCWNWMGAQNGRGYGQFHFDGKTRQAHWFLLHVKPSCGEEACHKCDNRLCVNPDHIFIGTRSDNMRDCVRKGRHKCTSFPNAGKLRKVWHRGESNHASKLTEEDAALIRGIGKGPIPQNILAKHFGVSLNVIGGIWSGKRWVHVQPASPQRCEAFLRLHGKWRHA